MTPGSGEPAAVAAGEGFLGSVALAKELNTLLEAERAGARVAARLYAEAGSPALKALAERVRRDEIRWCRMLDAAIRELGVTPSRAVGDFHEKANAIADPQARFAFLNRGQAWVVRRLQALLPRLPCDHLHGELLRMLAGHDHNIALTASALARPSSGADASPSSAG